MRSLGSWEVECCILMSAATISERRSIALSLLPLTRDSAFLRSFGWTLDLDRASAIENGGVMFIWTSPYNLIRYTTSTAFMIEKIIHPRGSARALNPQSNLVS